LDTMATLNLIAGTIPPDSGLLLSTKSPSTWQ
jgi:hypothetical protein